MSNKCSLVIEDIKFILKSNNQNCNNYTFNCKNNYLCLKYNIFCVKVNYCLFTEYDIENKTPEYINYLRKKINELFDKVYKPKKQCGNKGIIVLVHGAWHDGPLLENTANYIRKEGYSVYTPTITGNKWGDDRSTVNLTDAINSIVEYLNNLKLKNIILVAHSYGGMVISGVVDVMYKLNIIKRLVYWNAFVPSNGQSLNDMVPQSYIDLFNNLAAENNNSITLPFPIWRESFINYADYELANTSWNSLNPHPYLTFTEKINFKNFNELAEIDIAKSYINGYADTALPLLSDTTWSPRLSDKLGFYRYINHLYDHEILFYNPEYLAELIIKAGRD